MSLAEELLADLEDFEEDDTLQDNSVSHPDVEKEELKNDGETHFILFPHTYSFHSLFELLAF